MPFGSSASTHSTPPQQSSNLDKNELVRMVKARSQTTFWAISSDEAHKNFSLQTEKTAFKNAYTNILNQIAAGAVDIKTKDDITNKLIAIEKDLLNNAKNRGVILHLPELPKPTGQTSPKLSDQTSPKIAMTTPSAKVSATSTDTEIQRPGMKH